MRSVGEVRFRKASDQSLLIYFDEGDSLAAHRRVAGLLRRLESEPVAGLRNLHPAFRSLLLNFNALRRTHAEVEAEVRDRLDPADEASASESRVVEIPVCYGGEFGPDLDDVARLRGMTAEAVIELHSQQTYVTFAYLGDLPDALVTARLPTPRKVVPPGSVGIAGRQTGVYPFATPGGWRLLGRTPLKMFQRERAGMCLLRLGDRVRFVAIARERFGELERA